MAVGSAELVFCAGGVCCCWLGVLFGVSFGVSFAGVGVSFADS